MPHKNADQRREYQRAYRQRHRVERRAERPDYDRSRHANKRARIYGAPGKITVADVRRILAVGRCHYCGGTEQLGIDHVIGLHVGGPNTPNNIVACCHPCNTSKWRSDRPGRWSRERDSCAGCGTSEGKHLSGGLCATCYWAAYRKRKALHGGDRSVSASAGMESSPYV